MTMSRWLKGGTTICQINPAEPVTLVGLDGIAISGVHPNFIIRGPGSTGSTGSTLRGVVSAAGDILSASEGVSCTRESSGIYRIRFPTKNSEYYVVDAITQSTGRNITITLSEHSIRNSKY